MDRGSLRASGGHRESTPAARSDETPPNLVGDLSGANSGGQSSKRIREQEVESPRKRSAHSIEECVRDISETIKSLQHTCVPATEQMTCAMETLQEDGILETSPEYAKALILCKNPLDQTVFMNMKS